MPRLSRTLSIVILLCMVFGIWIFQGCGGGSGDDPVGPMVTGSISGTVNASGTLASLQGTEASLLAAVSVASVSVYIEDYPQYSARTDSAGKFVITPVPFGTHRLITVIQTSSNHVYKQRSGPITVTTSAPSPNAGSLSLLPATLYARIKLQDSSNQPVTGAVIRVWGQLFTSTTTPGEYISPPMPDTPIDPLVVSATNFQTTTLTPAFTPANNPAVQTVTLPKTTETNRAPVAGLRASSYSVSGVTQVTLTASASDLDGDGLDYSWVAAPGSVSSGSTALAAIWTPPSGTGVATITFTASERSPKTLSGKATVNVSYSTGGGTGNNPPTVDLVATVSSTVQVGSTITLTAANGSDPDGDAITYSWSASGGSLSGTAGTPVTWTAPGTIGQITITLTASDGKGGTASKDLVLTVSSSAPTPTGLTVKISSPLANQLLKKGTITFSGQATNNAGVVNPRDSYRWYVNGPGYAGLVAQDVKTFSLNIQTSATYTVWLQASDVSSTATDTVSFRINSLPVAHLLQPANNSLYLLGTPVTFVGSGSDTEDISIPSASITWWLNGAQVAVGSSTIQSGLPAGSSTMAVRVADRLGEYSTASITFGMNTPPVVTVVSPAPSTVFSAGDNVVFTGNASDPDTLTALTGNNVGWYRGTTFLGSGTSWDATSQLTPGASYTITFWAFDNAPGAARGFASTSFEIKINANASPTCAISSPTSPIMALQGSSITFTGIASDPEDGLFSNAINPGSMTWWLASGTTLPSPWPLKALGTGESFATTSFPIGTSTVIFNAADRWGTKATATVRVVGNAPPTFSITAPASSVYMVDQMLTFTGNGTNAFGAAVAAASMTWSVSPTMAGFDRIATSSFAYFVGSANSGTYTFTLSGYDSLGVQGSANKTIYFNAVPTASITFPLNWSRIDTAGSFTFRAEYGDQDALEPFSSVMWYDYFGGATSTLGAGVLSGNSPSAQSVLASTVTTLASGPHYISFAVADSQGVVATSSIWVLVDREPTISAIFTGYPVYTNAPGNVPVYLASSGMTLTFQATTSDYEANAPAGGAVANASLSWTLVTRGGGQTVISTSSAYPLDQTFSPGAATLTLRAVDSWGVATQATITFRIWDAELFNGITAPRGIDYLAAAKQFLITTGVGEDRVEIWKRSDAGVDLGKVQYFRNYTGLGSVKMVRGGGGGTGAEVASLFILDTAAPQFAVASGATSSTTAPITSAISFGSAGSDTNDGDFNSPFGFDYLLTGDTSLSGYRISFLFVGDTGNHRIRKVYMDGMTPDWTNTNSLNMPISGATAGSGQNEFSSPRGIRLNKGNDNIDYMYIADSGNSRIVKRDLNLNYKSQWASANDATEITFCDGSGSDIGAGANRRWMFVSSPSNNTVLVYDKDVSGTTPIMTIGGSGADLGRFNNPTGIYVIGDYLYVCETGGNRIHKILTGGW